MQLTHHLDLFGAQFQANPYPAYSWLHEHAPIYCATRRDGETVWAISRYDDAVAVLKDDRFVKDYRHALSQEHLAQLPAVPEIFAFASSTMADRDAPDHTRLRTLVSKAFTPRRIEQFRPRIQALADELLDLAEPQGGMDVIADFASPLSLYVIADLLGIPSADRPQLRQWSETLWSGRRADSVDELSVGLAFLTYAHQLIDARRTAPEDDLISALIAVEDDGDRLSQDELLGMLFLLPFAGHYTTTSFIGNAVFTLLQHPEQLAKLRATPALLDTAIEELLRYCGPIIRSNWRYAREDIEMRGHVIPKGARVMVLLDATSHDPDAFEQPNEFDIEQERRRHLQFGYGVHHCLSSALARLEGQIAVATLLRRMPYLRFAAERHAPSVLPDLVMRGLERLPIVF